MKLSTFIELLLISIYLGHTWKYVGLPSRGRAYKKRVSQQKVLKFITERKFF